MFYLCSAAGTCGMSLEFGKEGKVSALRFFVLDMAHWPWRCDHRKLQSCVQVANRG